jgi:hypothetical protein
VINRQANVLKSSGPAATGVSQPSIFKIAGDDSLASEGSAERANVLQVIDRLPETTMDYEQEWKGSSARREAQLSEMLRSQAVLDSIIEIWRRSFQDVAQVFFKTE